MSPKSTVLITGAARGIGRGVAEAIAEKGNFEVVLVARDTKRGEKAAEEIRSATGNPDVLAEVCDLTQAAEVRQMRERLFGGEGTGRKLAVLINNAAECPEPQEFVDLNGRKTDRQFASNVLGYHFMLRAFEDDLLKRGRTESGGGPARVVMVASNWAGDLDLSDLNFESRYYDNDTGYRQSKQADRMLSVEWAERFRELEGEGAEGNSSNSNSSSKIKNPPVIVNACHPGDPCTKLSCALGYNTSATKDCKRVCKSPVYLAFLGDLLGRGGNSGGGKAGEFVTGKWFEADCRPCRDSYASDRCGGERKKLWEICEGFWERSLE